MPVVNVPLRVAHRGERRELELEARVDRRDVVHLGVRAELGLDPHGQVVHLALHERADGAHRRYVMNAAVNGTTRK